MFCTCELILQLEVKKKHRIQSAAKVSDNNHDGFTSCYMFNNYVFDAIEYVLLILLVWLFIYIFLELAVFFFSLIMSDLC